MTETTTTTRTFVYEGARLVEEKTVTVFEKNDKEKKK